MKKFLTLLLVCMLAFALVACAPADDGTTAPDPEGGEGTATGPAEVRIGLIGPMTGAGAQYGAAMKEAAELAVEEINAAGGINGAEVVLFQEDDASTPAQAVSAAEKLITQDEVHFIVGNYNSSCSLAVMEVTMRESVPHINPISTAAAITESGSQFIFRNCATNPMQVTSVAEYLFATYPEATKYAIICENTDYGIGMREAFEALLPDHPEIEIVASEAYNAGDTDFMAQLTNIQAADPDVLFCLPTSPKVLSFTNRPTPSASMRSASPWAVAPPPTSSNLLKVAPLVITALPTSKLRTKTRSLLTSLTLMLKSGAVNPTCSLPLLMKRSTSARKLLKRPNMMKILLNIA